MGSVVWRAVAGRCYEVGAFLGNGANFSSCWVPLIVSGVEQGEGPGPECGAIARVDPYVRSAVKFQFVRSSAVA